MAAIAIHLRCPAWAAIRVPLLGASRDNKTKVSLFALKHVGDLAKTRSLIFGANGS